MPNISKKLRQSDNKTWSVNTIYHKKHSSSKIILKMWGETVLRTFSKKIKIKHISGSIIQSSVQFNFIVCQVKDYQNIIKLSRVSFAFTSYKIFQKVKKTSGTSLLALFSTWVLKKSITLVIFYKLKQISLSGCLYFVRYCSIWLL